MSAKGNPVIGAMIHGDGRLVPMPGIDPSAQWTYRPEPEPADAKRKATTKS